MRDKINEQTPSLVFTRRTITAHVEKPCQPGGSGTSEKLDWRDIDLYGNDPELRFFLFFFKLWSNENGSRVFLGTK